MERLESAVRLTPASLGDWYSLATRPARIYLEENSRYVSLLPPSFFPSSPSYTAYHLTQLYWTREHSSPFLSDTSILPDAQPHNSLPHQHSYRTSSRGVLRSLRWEEPLASYRFFCLSGKPRETLERRSPVICLKWWIASMPGILMRNARRLKVGPHRLEKKFRSKKGGTPLPAVALKERKANRRLGEEVINDISLPSPPYRTHTCALWPCKLSTTRHVLLASWHRLSRWWSEREEKRFEEEKGMKKLQVAVMQLLVLKWTLKSSIAGQGW